MCCVRRLEQLGPQFAARPSCLTAACADVLAVSSPCSWCNDPTRYFPDYTGPAEDVAGAQNFICDKFLALNKNPRKQIYKHFTCATDTGNIDMVFKSVSDIIEEKFLDMLGLGMN